MPLLRANDVTYMPTTGAYYRGHEENMRHGMQVLAQLENPMFPTGDATSTLATSAAQAYPRNLGTPGSYTDTPDIKKYATQILDPETYGMAEQIGLNKRAILERTLTAADVEGGRDNLDHLILIRLYNQLMGDQMRWFHLDNMFNEMVVDKLLLRMSFRDNPSVVQEVPPRQPYDITKVTYDEIKFDLTKKVTSWDIAMEDPMRALISPMIPLEQSNQYAMAHYREIEGLDALKQLKYHYNRAGDKGEKFDLQAAPGNDAGKLHSLARITGQNVHSAFYPVDQLQEARNEFMEENDCMLTHFAVSPTSAMRFAQNTWTEPNTIFNVEAYRTNGGVRPFPGLSDALMVISQLVPNDQMYAISKPMNIMVKAEGPKISKTWDDPSRFTMQTATLDFHQYKCAAEDLSKLDRRFGCIFDLVGV